MMSEVVRSKYPWAGIAAAVMALASSASWAQTAGFPAKPIRLVVPYGAGAGTTIAIKFVTDKAAADLGQNIIIDSRLSAGGIIANKLVAQSQPDGYTLLAQSASLFSTHWTNTDLGYDTMKDLMGVATLGINAHMIAIHPSVPASDLKELVAYARQNPGKLNSATSGIGSNNHIENLLFMQATGTKLTIVPYKGGVAAAINDLLSGAVQFSFNTPSNFIPLIKAGKLKGIAIGGKERDPMLPDVPTFAEGGLKNFEAGNWYALFAPAATPAPVTARLHDAINRALEAKDVQAAMTRLSMAPFRSSLAETRAFLQSEFDNYGKVIKDNDLKASD